VEEQIGRDAVPIRPGAHGKLCLCRKAEERHQVLPLQESKDHMNISMVSDHITRMEKTEGSYRSEYETALKHASATTLSGKSSLTRISKGWVLLIVYTGAADTVCTGLLKYGYGTYKTHRRVRH